MEISAAPVDRFERDGEVLIDGLDADWIDQIDRAATVLGDLLASLD